MTSGPASGFEYVKAFATAAEEVLAEVLSLQAVCGPPRFLVDPCFQDHDVNIQIEITGHLCGRVNFALEPHTAMQVASSMMEEPVSSLDEMSLSAVCELANMIAGNARTHLNADGTNSNVGSPVLLRPDSGHSRWGDSRAIFMPLSLGVGAIGLTVGIGKMGGA